MNRDTISFKCEPRTPSVTSITSVTLNILIGNAPNDGGNEKVFKMAMVYSFELSSIFRGVDVSDLCP